MEEAMNYEIRRQIREKEDGRKIIQETLLYDPDLKVTKPMRSKEDSQDYRYFPDPDLPPLVISREWVARVQAGMPELPSAMRQRLIDELGLPVYDASVLTQSKAMATYFEDVVKLAGKDQAKQAANWLMGDVSSTLNREACDIADIPVSATQLALVLKRINDGTISNKIAKDLFRAMWDEKSSDPALADQLIEKNDWKSNNDSGALEAIIDDVLAANAKSVEEFRAGKEKAFNALIGQAMKATKGKANPAQLTELLKKKLS